jgi:hypothetical protein
MERLYKGFRKSHAMETNKEGTMSQVPFSISNADNIIGGSHVLKKHASLNNLLRRRRPKAKVNHLFGIVAVALLLLASQLTACGNAAPFTGSASADSTSAPGSTSTAEPTRGPTSVSTTQTAVGPTKNQRWRRTQIPGPSLFVNERLTYGVLQTYRILL